MVDIKDQTAIVGIGWTKYSKNSGVTPLALAVEASMNAIEDAGLTAKDIDGIMTYSINDSINTNVVSTALGMPEMRYFIDITHGGPMACQIVGSAAAAVATGMADCVLVYRAMNGYSGFRQSGGDFPLVTEHTGCFSDAESQFMAPYGALIPTNYYGLITRRYMHKYGLTTEQLGSVAVQCRKNACLNERAQMRSPMTMEDYMNVRMISEPLRLYDCCIMSDGACAVIVTSAERAKDLKHPPVYIVAAAQGSGPHVAGGTWANYYADQTVSYGKYVAPILYERAGMGPQDIDIAEIYDCYTISLIMQLEDFGFCQKGEGGAYVESGETELGGHLPVNTHGGLLSEAYIHGLNHTVEAVSQLRGDAGVRQVKDAEVALVTAGGGVPLGSALILRR